MYIRYAKMSDIDRIEEIYNRIHTQEEKGEIFVGWDRAVYPTRDTALMALSRGDLFVMEDEEQVVASALINRIQVPEYAKCPWEYSAEDEQVMVIHTLTVDPEMGNRGYGKAFIKYYEEYAAVSGCPELRMDTNEKNQRARKLYKKLGYSEPGVVECTFNGIPGVRLVCLEKNLETGAAI